MGLQTKGSASEQDDQTKLEFYNMNSFAMIPIVCRRRMIAT